MATAAIPVGTAGLAIEQPRARRRPGQRDRPPDREVEVAEEGRADAAAEPDEDERTPWRSSPAALSAAPPFDSGVVGDGRPPGGPLDGDDRRRAEDPARSSAIASAAPSPRRVASIASPQSPACAAASAKATARGDFRTAEQSVRGVVGRAREDRGSAPAP